MLSSEFPTLVLPKEPRITEGGLALSVGDEQNKLCEKTRTVTT